MSNGNNDNNKSNNKRKKKKVRDNRTTMTPKQFHLSQADEELLDQRLRQLRQEALDTINSETKGGWDKIHAIKNLLALDGYDSKTLADGWRKQNGFHL